ncbi:hypothetical protein [Burkholderia ubonensis]|uniref:hypothetical protein n=1 Tax=Burkholderia ubonensis TaxID=101571 RepID=UPI000A6A557C|nr:hypothetical protein [Burkholderia ubonensis]
MQDIDKDDNSWVTLDYFKITHKGMDQDNLRVPFYGNGRQQTELRIFLRARNKDGEIVSIPKHTLNSIKLIDYDTGQQLSPIEYYADLHKGDYSEYPDWARVKNDNDDQATVESDHGEFSAGQPDELDLPAQPHVGLDPRYNEIQMDVQTFWVSTTNLAMRRIGAYIENWKPVGPFPSFKTNDRDVPPGGNGQAGKFNSSVTLAPQRAPNYPIEAFRIDPVLVYTSGTGEFVSHGYNHYISLTEPKGNKIKLTGAGAHEGPGKSIAKAKRNSANRHITSTTGYWGDVDNQPTVDPRLRENYINTIVKDIGVRGRRNGEFVVVHLQDRTSHSSNPFSWENSEVRFNIMDEFGNEHNVMCSHDRDDIWRLLFSKA